MNRNDSERGLFETVVFAIPVLGWMLREIVEERPQAGFWFAVSLASVAGILVLTFGLAGLVLAAMLAGVVAFIGILAVTKG